MSTEQRRGIAQREVDILEQLTADQHKAFAEDLRAYGWELVAVRQSPTTRPVTLVQAPGGAVARILCENGNVDFLNHVKARAPEPPPNNESIQVAQRRGRWTHWRSWLTGKPLYLEGN